MPVIVDGLAWLPTAEYKPETLERLRGKLTKTPKVWGAAEVDPIKLYVDRPGYLGIPREYFLERAGSAPFELRTTYGDPTAWRTAPVAFAGKLRPPQETAVTALLDAWRAKNLGSILQALPGTGKTVMGLATVAHVRLPTLVVVHKEFLRDQWLERIRQYLPDAKVGLIQGDTCDYRGKHIVVGMAQTLWSKPLPSEALRYFGLMLVDEVHRMGAPTWSKIPARFPARLRLGLTATPDRKDGLADAFRWHIGPIRYSSSEVLLKAKIRRIWTDFELEGTVSQGEAITLLARNRPRNLRIAEEVAAACRAGRKVLVLSERLEHLAALDEAMYTVWDRGRMPTIAKYVGGMDSAERVRAAKAQVILATTQFVSEALDIPELDTLVLATPVSDMAQIIGRICRPHPDKQAPIVVDFRDDEVALFKSQGRKRDAQYVHLAH